MKTKVNFYFLDFQFNSNYYNSIKLKNLNQEFKIIDQILIVDIERDKIPILSGYYFTEKIVLFNSEIEKK